MSDGQSDYKAFMGGRGRIVPRVEDSPAPQFQAIPWSWAARPMTAADLGLPERAPPYHWLGREAE